MNWWKKIANPQFYLGKHVLPQEFEKSVGNFLTVKKVDNPLGKDTRAGDFQSSYFLGQLEDELATLSGLCSRLLRPDSYA
ncbi:hypothetical protein [Echinicola rosea]|uniref:Uncharacterized protein n=1 Tax=Echinicola rosea TaxID=1807691 RepID=A0ABQ1UZ20_9BACT|nr:hypothetical protein [Echinicola rosea]GGF30538.1 hypothetical protein GCM10011339_18390 [Echinicola rosea]